MYKKFIVVLISFCLIFVFGNFSLAKSSKKAQNKKKEVIPVYFYENVNKNDFFMGIDEYMQKKKYKLSMYYPELGFIHIKNNDISILIKQFGRDVYLLVYPPEKKSGKLESIDNFTNDITNYMKKTTQNSYPIIDEYFYTQLQKDLKQIQTTRQSSLNEDTFNPNSDVYEFSVKRYVGYKKYKLSKLDKAKKKAQHKIDKQYYKQKAKSEQLIKKQQNKKKDKNKQKV